MLTMVLVFVTLAFTVSAATSATLDDKTTSTTAVQKYTFKAANNSGYQEVTKVKVSWTIADLQVTYDSAKTWNDENLSWDESGVANITVVSGNKPTFTFENRGTKAVTASVSFKQAQSFNAGAINVTFTNNNSTVKSVVNATTHAVDKTINHSLTITGDVTIDGSKFNGTKNTSGETLGTYTITIGTPR